MDGVGVKSISDPDGQRDDDQKRHQLADAVDHGRVPRKQVFFGFSILRRRECGEVGIAEAALMATALMVSPQTGQAFSSLSMRDSFETES